MSRSSRLLSVVVLVAAGLVALPHSASAAVDAACQFSKAKKLVTLTLPADDHDEGDFILGRVAGSKRIGFDSDEIEWKVCGSASVENTNTIKVVGSQQSETLVVSVDGGMLGPGAANESAGSDEIEIVGDLGDGTDTLVLAGGDGSDRLSIDSRTSATFNADDDRDISLDGVDSWRMYGGIGQDVLDAHGAPQVNAYGQEGSDRVIGGNGADNLYGDGGEDSADGNDIVLGGGGRDSIYGGGGSDRLSGGDEDDYLRGEKGNDVVAGGDGSDSIYSEAGADGSDDVTGGPGTDTAGYSSRQQPVRVSLDGKANDGAEGEDDRIRTDVERLSGSGKDDVLVGNGANNSLYGNAGADVLKGLGGNDTLYPDDGEDTSYGGAGDDYLSNSIGMDRLFGEGGDDSLSAGSAEDGRDVFSGGSGNDSISYSARVLAVTIDVTTDSGDGGVAENDFVHSDFEYIYGGSEADNLHGGSNAERLYGFNGNDVINGGRGADNLNGGAGNDDLTGGEGYDGVYGDADDDSLFLDSDSASDYGDCGSGTDTVYVDPYDASTGCESILP